MTFRDVGRWEMDCKDEITVRGRKNKVGNGICGTKLFLKHQIQTLREYFNKTIGFGLCVFKFSKPITQPTASTSYGP